MQQCRRPGYQWTLMDCEGMQLCLTLSGSGALALVREMAELIDPDSRVEITDLVVDLLRRRRLERGGAQPVSRGLGQAIHDECQWTQARTITRGTERAPAELKEPKVPPAHVPDEAAEDIAEIPCRRVPESQWRRRSSSIICCCCTHTSSAFSSFALYFIKAIF